MAERLLKKPTWMMYRRYKVRKAASVFLPDRANSLSVVQVYGEVAEWLKAHAWKVCIGLSLSRVRIPPSPPKLRKGPVGPFLFFLLRKFNSITFVFHALNPSGTLPFII